MTTLTNRAADLAINGGTPVRQRPFPSWPVWGDEERRNLTAVLESGKWWRGAYHSGELDQSAVDDSNRSLVEIFEQKFAAMHGARHGLAVTSGAAALEVAVRAVGIGPGDEVITTPYTMVATSLCVLNSFAIPVYADIAPHDYNIDADQLESLVTERTRAIVIVHFGGQLCDMEQICAVARKYGLRVIEDAAHAHGVMDHAGRCAGAFGDIGCFSFQAAKNLATGEGGMVITNDKELYDRCFSIHHYGRRPGELWYKHFMTGWNYRMNEFTAAVGIPALQRLHQQNELRQANCDYLTAGLARIPCLTPITDTRRQRRHSRHLVIIRYDRAKNDGVHRDDLIKALVAEGIPAMAGYTFPNYANPLFYDQETKDRFKAAGIDFPDYSVYRERCPNVERACNEEAIWLEHRLLLGTREDMDDIITAFTKVTAALGG
ncbi:MAG TPA: DegT/DnrJ/EryC1/StrS family aminotransferase [Candidatus Sumerlaeota bacterium]|nr:DegT/DnrJ/EryC1/StrS family aminotransferase [Candidatus Sumerlaeota bacterium]HOR28738.1 DegT/DnrJ/EryC1/StrS family aminotransferase [Candidatus Sumerlaeota bacterium]